MRVSENGHYLFLASLFVPTHFSDELYTQMGFFVQSILAYRNIHRREL